MKAAVLYGNEDLRYDDYPTPEVTPGTVKVKVRATGICGSDVPRVLHHGAHFYAGPRVFRRCSRGGGRRNQA